MRLGGERGQASIELIGVLPLVMVLILAAAEVLAAGGARSAASSGAEAGAMAILQGGGDPASAARAAAPGWAHARLDVRVARRRVTVRATPPALLPWLPSLLASTATAAAGPGS